MKLGLYRIVILLMLLMSSISYIVAQTGAVSGIVEQDYQQVEPNRSLDRSGIASDLSRCRLACWLDH